MSTAWHVLDGINIDQLRRRGRGRGQRGRGWIGHELPSLFSPTQTPDVLMLTNARSRSALRGRVDRPPRPRRPLVTLTRLNTCTRIPQDRAVTRIQLDLFAWPANSEDGNPSIELKLTCLFRTGDSDGHFAWLRLIDENDLPIALDGHGSFAVTPGAHQAFAAKYLDCISERR